jgi:hypothetical protein
MRNTEVINITNEALQMKDEKRKAALSKTEPRPPLNNRPSVPLQQNPIVRQDSAHLNQGTRMDIERRTNS